MPIGLIALALGGFGIGLTEFVIMGLLPEVAADFHVTEATAGWLISGYALAVVVGALLLTAAVTRFERKPVLAVLMVLFIAGNLVSAIARDYDVMMVGRIIAALCPRRVLRHRRGGRRQHGRARRRRPAPSPSCSPGLTAANVLGVPFGTLLGQAAGWRSTFWAITGIGVLALVGIVALVPRPQAGRRPTAARRSARRTPRLPLRPGLALLAGDRPGLRRHVRRLHLHRLHADRGHRLRRPAPCRGC